MKFYLLSALVAITSITSFLVLPVELPKLYKNRYVAVINEFNRNSNKIRTIFKTDLTSQKALYPKNNTTFNVDDLKKFGKEIGEDFNPLIKKINQPYGSYWIDVALLKTINATTDKFGEKTYKITFTILFFEGVSIIVGLFLLLVISLISKRYFYKTNSKTIPYLFTLFLSIAILIFLYLYSNTLLKILKNPILISSYQNNISLIFLFRFTVIIFLLVFTIIFSFLSFKMKFNTHFYIFFTAPILLILISLFTQPKNLSNYYNIYKNQNKNFIIRKYKEKGMELLSEIRQWSKINSIKKLSDFNLNQIINQPLKTKFAFYKIKKDTDKLIIESSINNNRIPLKFFFYPEKDSVFISGNAKGINK